MKRLIVFDLDGTLAASKSPIEPEMVALLDSLLAIVRVAVISGGSWLQFERQLLANLIAGEHLERLSLLPTCGTQFYEYDSTWQQRYSESFDDQDRRAILAALELVVRESSIEANPTWGEQIEDRGGQVTLSALGQQAPLAAKMQWDPDFSKRQVMKTRLEQLIPQFSVRLGGTTSIDVTRQGIDKAYGIGKLRDIHGIAIDEMLFIGDALFPGGTDYPAEQAGVRSIRIRDPEQTQLVGRTILACCDASCALSAHR
jgi:phosphomannomutase